MAKFLAPAVLMSSVLAASMFFAPISSSAAEKTKPEPPAPPVAPRVPEGKLVPGKVWVEIYEGVPNKKSWHVGDLVARDGYLARSFAFVDVPKKYSERGIHVDRTSPFLIRAYGSFSFAPGEWRVLLRARNAARLYIDGQPLAETPFHKISAGGHGTVERPKTDLAPHIRPLARGDNEALATFAGDGKSHLVSFEMIVGGQSHRPDFGETGVFIGRPGRDFAVLAAGDVVRLTDEEWPGFVADERAWLADLNRERRLAAGAAEARYWQRRHDWARDSLADWPAPAVPKPTPGFEAAGDIDHFVNQRLAAAGHAPPASVADAGFLRRLALDTIGAIPSPDEIERFLGQAPSRRRELAIDAYLAHPGWADHWVGYWQDLLAENPNIVNPTLNNTGPFRWWIHESFADNKPLDRFASELVMMEGSTYFGGPGGFALSTQNDAPMAAKAHIVAQAFLAVEMKCARCHDAPYHDVEQKDLFSLAAMLARAPQKVPATSTVPVNPSGRKPQVKITLAVGASVDAEWPLASLAPPKFPKWVVRPASDTRARLAALVTSPHNRRFARVLANRLWKRYFGVGLVEPADDWEQAKPADAGLLDYLARELVAHDYDAKHLARLLLGSRAYQRQRESDSTGSSARLIAFGGQPRRMEAEQLLDSLAVACGKPLDAGPMSVDIDGARAFTQSLDLGEPTRAWMFTSLSNERDRPSLALPQAQPYVTLLEAFGWTGARQSPASVREHEPTPLQPAIMANGWVVDRATRLSARHAATQLALEDIALDTLIDRLSWRFVTRAATLEERARFQKLLAPGYSQRRIIGAVEPSQPRPPIGLVTWSNHLDPEATRVKAELETWVRQGEPATCRLDADWRERLEDVLWSLVNSPEFIFIP